MCITNSCVVTSSQKFNYTATVTQSVACGDEDTTRVSKEYGTRTNLIVDVIIPFVATQDRDR